jgi:hypothetical protein
MTAKELLKNAVDGLSEEDAALWLVRLRNQGPPGGRLTLADLAELPVAARKALIRADWFETDEQELAEWDPVDAAELAREE